MAVSLANIDITADSFGTWIVRTNQLVDKLSTVVVTLNGANNSGNLDISGIISSNGISTNNITLTGASGNNIFLAANTSTNKLYYTTITKAQVGLSNVDNTSDANKPISTAGQSALDLKVDTSIYNSHTGNTSNPHSVTKTQVGLGNVDNTADIDKPVSSATQTLINNKAAEVDGSAIAYAIALG